MRRCRYSLAAVLLAAAAVLTGCSMLDRIVGADDWKAWTPSETAVRILGDGSVTETILDRLDQSWYTGDELQDMIARSMNEYNAEHGEDAILVTEYSDEGGDVRVTIIYRSAEDFAAYNNVSFFDGSMLDAELSGYLFEGPFRKVQGTDAGAEDIDASEPLSHKEYDVAISDGTHDVQVPGEIRYVSTGAKIINSHTAGIPADARESTGDGETADAAAGAGQESGFLYIIYEKDQDADLLHTDVQTG